MTKPMRWILAGLLGLASLSDLPRVSAADDPLGDAKARMAIEAQRVEREFAAGRAAAYKLVRNDDPQLADATQKLQDLLALVRADTSLDDKRRQVLLVTIKADLDRVSDIAGEKKRFTASEGAAEINRAVRDDVRRSDEVRRAEPSRRVSDDAKSVSDSRRAALDAYAANRVAKASGRNSALNEVDKSAIPEPGNIRFDKERWLKISKLRATAQKTTAKERAIFRALDSTLNADYSDKFTFEEVIEHLRKVSKVDIVVDKRALEEAGVSYETTVKLKMKTSMRTVLKRILADLNLAYVVKDEAILITSRERASQMTTTRTYYLGDLAAATGGRYPPYISRALAIQNINNMIQNITSTIDPQSWKVNNPDAVGTIAFDPVTMSLTIKQVAEIHYKLGGQ
jgi:hypothetical protein